MHAPQRQHREDGAKVRLEPSVPSPVSAMRGSHPFMHTAASVKMGSFLPFAAILLNVS
jgi:hypothetical protein